MTMPKCHDWGFMSFLKTVLFPYIIAGLIAYPSIFILNILGYFNDLSELGSVITGVLASLAGIVVGYILAWKLI